MRGRQRWAWVLLPALAFALLLGAFVPAERRAPESSLAVPDAPDESRGKASGVDPIPSPALQAPDVSNTLDRASLESRGPPRPQPLKDRERTRLSEPLKPQLDRDLDAALAGDGALAAELASKLEGCRGFQERVQNADAAAQVERAMGSPIGVIEARERLLLHLMA